jgi:hypothetical protein
LLFKAFKDDKKFVIEELFAVCPYLALESEYYVNDKFLRTVFKESIQADKVEYLKVSLDEGII